MVLLESQMVPLGTPAPDFSLKGIDDRPHTLHEYADKDILVIIFMCNHCPYVQAVFYRLIAIQNDYDDQGVQLVGINANDPTEYPEDSLEKMKEEVQKRAISFVYLQDESQTVARAYQAQCTPDIYVFDQERQLAYHGRIDDNWQEPGQVTRNELRAAIDALLAGQKPSLEQKPSMGCSIKWKS